jgi:hypothetical protein
VSSTFPFLDNPLAVTKSYSATLGLGQFYCTFEANKTFQFYSRFLICIQSVSLDTYLISCSCFVCIQLFIDIIFSCLSSCCRWLTLIDKAPLSRHRFPNLLRNLLLYNRVLQMFEFFYNLALALFVSVLQV